MTMGPMRPPQIPDRARAIGRRLGRPERISAAQVSLVAAAYRPLEVVETTRMDDWVAVTLIRR